MNLSSTLLAVAICSPALTLAQPAETANSCLLVHALSEVNRIDFRDGSYVTRNPTDIDGVLRQEQFAKSGRLRFQAQVMRRTGVDTTFVFDPDTYIQTIRAVAFDGYDYEGPYRCYEIDGRGYKEGERYASDYKRLTPYKEVYPNGKTAVEGSFKRYEDSVGVWRINDELGQLSEEINFDHGNRVGPYKRLGSDGQVLARGQYYRGQSQDTIQVFNPDTYETHTKVVVLNGSPCGMWQVRDAGGVLKEETYAPCEE